MKNLFSYTFRPIDTFKSLLHKIFAYKNCTSKIIFASLIFFLIGMETISTQTDCNAPDLFFDEEFNETISTMSATGPYYIRIYIHVIRDGDGNGGQSEDAVYDAVETLDEDFNDHDIFFVWDCVIDYIDDDDYFKDPSTSIYEVKDHDDGVDIYLFPDDNLSEIAGGWANEIGKYTHLIVFGTDPDFGPVIQSHVISHEMGHVLGLLHTHAGCDQGGTWEFPDGSNCGTAGDFVCDTPADPNMYWNVNSSCEWLELAACIPPSPYELEDFNPDENNIMAYTRTSCMQYLTEDQGQRMRNAIEEVSYLEETLVEEDLCPCGRDIHITENTTYDEDMFIRGNVFVHPGAQLTITSKLRFAKDRAIIVEPNGRLLVNGGHLTSGCDPWQGIVVIGDSDEHQYTY